jgi:5-methylcytosine-specific restriction endonuclease McrA
MTYKAGWGRQRRLCIERDKRCQKCGVLDDLQVHHKQERCEGGSDDLSNMIVLCGACHYEWTAVEYLDFDSWLLTIPAKYAVAIFSQAWPEDMSAADFKWQVLKLLDAAYQVRR